MYMYDFQFFILNNIYCKFLIQENKKKTEDDRDMMNQEKTGLEKEIKQWEAQFKKKNGREPTEEDKYERLQSQHSCILTPFKVCLDMANEINWTKLG